MIQTSQPHSLLGPLQFRGPQANWMRGIRGDPLVFASDVQESSASERFLAVEQTIIVI